jgi:acyl-CoA synthetase (AMP-forming)/AMP-acid ligase II
MGRLLATVSSFEAYSTSVCYKNPIGYALSEACAAVMSTPDLSLFSGENSLPAPTRAPTGILLPGRKARIILDTGEDAPLREVGELWVAGGNVTPGYFHNTKATEEAFFRDVNGETWCRTGDRFWTDGVWF